MILDTFIFSENLLRRRKRRKMHYKNLKYFILFSLEHFYWRKI